MQNNSTQGISLVNYDVNCPTIFNLIESKDWVETIKHTKLFPSDIKTWIIRKESNGNLKWRLLPIHAAIIFNAPKEVINSLLDAFPESAKCIDDIGMTPLSREINKSNPTKELIEVLTRKMIYPYGIINYKDCEDQKFRIRDYHVNCPQLYILIQSKVWSKVISRVITNPEEAQTWVIRKDEDGNILWRHLPLHECLKLDPPFTVVEALMTGYMDAILCCDYQGLLPIQQAVDSGCNEGVINSLVEALENPDGICLKDKAGNVLLTNYDVNPTKIYMLLESRDWEEVSSYIDLFPGEVKTWVMRKQLDGKVRWRMLPIHAAVIFGAPCEVVKELLNAYKEGARCRDDLGMIPLDMAKKKNARYDVIEVLYSAFPQGEPMT